jgi:hypothetical protein
VKVPVKGSSAGIGGTAAFAQTLASMHGSSANPLTPDVNLEKSHHDGVDEAVRAAIDTAVLQLIKRVDGTTETGSAN